jgi:DNA-binding beta-propeller fold protein YncE
VIAFCAAGVGRTNGRAPLPLYWTTILVLLSAGRAEAQKSSGDRPAYRSPIDVAYSPDGSFLAVADRTWPGLSIINPSDGSVVREVKLLGDPYHVLWNGSDKVLVAEGSNGTVAEVEAASGNVLRRIVIGKVAKGLALTKDGRLLACDRALNKLVVVKLDAWEIESTIDVGREPGTVAVTQDGKYAVVGNKLPPRPIEWPVSLPRRSASSPWPRMRCAVFPWLREPP